MKGKHMANFHQYGCPECGRLWKATSVTVLGCPTCNAYPPHWVRDLTDSDNPFNPRPGDYRTRLAAIS